MVVSADKLFECLHAYAEGFLASYNSLRYPQRPLDASSKPISVPPIDDLEAIGLFRDKRRPFGRTLVFLAFLATCAWCVHRDHLISVHTLPAWISLAADSGRATGLPTTSSSQADSLIVPCCENHMQEPLTPASLWNTDERYVPTTTADRRHGTYIYVLLFGSHTQLSFSLPSFLYQLCAPSRSRWVPSWAHFSPLSTH
jgi:hypothetical protein